jgi:hypothetical protein
MVTNLQTATKASYFECNFGAEAHSTHIPLGRQIVVGSYSVPSVEVDNIIVSGTFIFKNMMAIF